MSWRAKWNSLADCSFETPALENFILVTAFDLSHFLELWQGYVGSYDCQVESMPWRGRKETQGDKHEFRSKCCQTWPPATTLYSSSVFCAYIQASTYMQCCESCACHCFFHGLYDTSFPSPSHGTRNGRRLMCALLWAEVQRSFTSLTNNT